MRSRLNQPGVSKLMDRFQTKLSLAGALLPGPVDRHLNESWFLHGSRPELILSVLQNGFNERLCTTQGLFGGGTYLAEDAAKVDQYCTSDSVHCGPGLEDLHRRLYRGGVQHAPGTYYAFACRAVCGLTIFSRDGFHHSADGRRSIWANMERRELCFVPGVSPAMNYQSLVGELSKVGATPSRDCDSSCMCRTWVPLDKDLPLISRFREFIVFDSARVYPEYLLAFRRV